ncbi:MAG TPA: hypothetical protein VFQ53_38550 [Kofleriaceae bacterium]|nr:hypothetical protein [Kofleriaceae bacterium]
MKRAALLVLALAATAHARSVVPPTTWTADTKTAVALTTQLGEMPQFGGRRAIVTTEVYRPPAGGALYVTRVVANVPAGERDLAASTQLEELRGAMRRQGRTADEWTPKVTATPPQLEASVVWKDPAANAVTTGRTVIAADAQQIVSVTGECVLAADAPAGVASACKAALATLDPELPADGRVALQIVDVPVGSGTAVMNELPPLSGGSDRPVLQPMSFPETTREPDRRPVYVGAGLVLLAIVFWWNRRRRERFEDDAAGKPARGKRSGDADADDLHAAAEAPADDAATEVPADDAGDGNKDDKS